MKMKGWVLYFIKNLQEYCINKEGTTNMSEKITNTSKNKNWISKFLDAIFVL